MDLVSSMNRGDRARLYLRSGPRAAAHRCGF